ncbi:MAG: HEPN domain-containing protein [Caldisericota bacterium]|nr:HEPN domain-containing protein [Caldisericota bacterium]
MSSVARQNLEAQLADFDELMAARDAICSTGAGRPARRQGAAVIRGGVLLLSAAFEGYVEDVFDLAADLILAGYPHSVRKQFKKDTSGRLNNADVRKVNMLFFNIGIPWIMGHPKLHWRKFTNKSVQDTLNALIGARNSNAHGKPRSVRKTRARFWRNFIARLGDKLDEIVSDEVASVTGSRPW